MTDPGPLFMIDTAGARDRDDAFAVRRDGSGGWHVDVHVAAVADHVPLGSAVDTAAYERRETRYLRTRTIPMLGEATEQAATLTTNSDRTTLAIRVTLGVAGRITAVHIAHSTVPAGRCHALDHQEAARVLRNPGHRLHEPLRAAEELAQILYATRLDNGALAFYDLLHGWAANEDGAIAEVPVSQRTSAYIIVQELMILANTALAGWAAERGLPILYRNQQTNPVTGDGSTLVEELAAAAADPARFDRIRSRVQATLRRAEYAPTVHGHYALALAAYTHATSPLRRVTDLITQRIVFAHLADDPAPYSIEELRRLATDLTDRAHAARDAKSLALKEIDKRTTVAAAAAANLAQLDTERWSKVLKLSVEEPAPTPAIEDELRRRSTTGDLPVIDVARVLGTGPQWLTLREHVLADTASRHPEYGPSVLSVWLQSQQQAGTDECEHRQLGPSHAPLFAARVRTPSACGKWSTAATKKAAQHGATWNLLRVIAGLESNSSPDQEPEFGAPSSAPAPARQPAPAGQQTAMAWLNHHMQTAKLPPPQWDTRNIGPDHAPTFTTSVTFAGHTATGTGPTKAAARTAAANALVGTLIVLER